MLTLKTNFAWLLTGQAVFSALQFVVLIALARFTTPAHVGAYSLALAVTTPIAALCALGLRTVYTTDFAQKYPPQHYLWLRAWGMAAAATLIIAVALYYQASPLAAAAILLIGASKISEGFADIYYAFTQKKERQDIIAKSMILRATLSTAIFTALLILNHSVTIALTAYAATWLVVLLTYDRTAHNAPNWQKFLTPQTLAPLAKYALPMGLATTVYMVAQNGVRYVIEAKLGLEALGEFAAIAYALMLGQIVINTLGQILRPRLAKSFTNQDAQTFKHLTKIGLMGALALGSAFTLGSALAGKFALGILYGESYTHLAPLLTLLGLASVPLFMGTFMGYVLSATGAYTQTLYLSLAGVATSIGTALVWVPQYGLLGAIYSTAALGTVFCLALSIISHKLKS